jgi:hypothetical protein
MDKSEETATTGNSTDTRTFGNGQDIGLIYLISEVTVTNTSNSVTEHLTVYVQNTHSSVFHFNTSTVHVFLFFYSDRTNAQLFHKLSHRYMFRHYRVILRELVINTLPSYTGISNAAVGNTIYN